METFIFNLVEATSLVIETLDTKMKTFPFHYNGTSNLGHQNYFHIPWEQIIELTEVTYPRARNSFFCLNKTSFLLARSKFECP
jgi:hypothetical protein